MENKAREKAENERIFKNCRVCFTKDTDDSFYSVFDNGTATREFFLENFGTSFHHYMYNKRKALVCTFCYGVISGNPTEEQIQSLFDQFRFHQINKFSEAERKFFNWKFVPKNDFKPKKADFFAKPVDAGQFAENVRQRNENEEWIQTLKQESKMREENQENSKILTRSQALQAQAIQEGTGVILRRASSMSLMTRKMPSRRAKLKRSNCNKCAIHLKTKKKLPCKKCGKEFACMKELRVHLRTCKRPKQAAKSVPVRHAKKMAHKVPTASARFSKKNPGKVTLPTKDRRCLSSIKKRPKICSICHKSLIHLYRHIREVHLKIRRHECSRCGKRFSRLYDMLKHKQCHQGSFRCIVCKKIYQNKGALRRHLRMKHHLRYYK